MVFMLRLIPGILLFCLCVVQTTDIEKPILADKPEPLIQTDENATIESQSKEDNNSHKFEGITDRDIENIVKPFKFAKTNPENFTSIKLKKSESYSTTQKPIQENSRTGKGRSVDIDIEKYISPDFHNAVYTLPVSSNTKRYGSNEEFHSHYSSTEEAGSFESMGHLTTPRTPYFDQKYKETVDSVNQKLEADHLGAEFDNLTIASNYSSDNLIEEVDKNPNETKLEHEIFENLKLNETKKPHNGHKEDTKETRKILNYESQFNKTTYYDEVTPSDDSNELHKENVKYLLGGDNVNDVRKEDTAPSTVRTNFHITTRKYSITKPHTERSDAGVISNKIESETLKSVSSTIPFTNPVVKTESTTSRPTTARGSIKFADYQKMITTTGTTVQINKTLEQTVQENQIIPIQITPPPTIAETTTSQLTTRTTEPAKTLLQKNTTEMTTLRIENVSARNNTIEPEEQQSTTVLIIVQPDEIRHDTSTRVQYDDVVTMAVTSTPRGFSNPTINTILPTTGTQKTTAENLGEAVTTSTTLSDLEDTTIIEDITTKEMDSVTDELITTEASTSSYMINETDESTITPLETTTTPLDTTTTHLETTEINMDNETTSETRSSKDIKYTEVTSSITTAESTVPSTIKLTDAPETSTLFFSPTTAKEIVTETVLIESTTQTEIRTTTTSLPREKPSEVSTKVMIESTPAKTLLENQTTEEKSTQETKTTPTTAISFVHIKTIDKNHTTLLPDILKPNEIYTTPIPFSETSSKTTTETTSTDETTHFSELEGPGGGNGAIVAIIISCVGGVCLIVLACLLIVMRNRQKRFNYGQRCRPVSLDDYSVDNVSVFNSFRRKAAARTSKRSYGNPAFEDPVCLTHPLNFPAISKFAANEDDVSSEFNDIPQIIARTSELPEGCETKNRYANVIPLPESRVFLNMMDGYPNSDYINANYITGPKNVRKYYIACQAPMSNTVDDFWRMIWEQQCKVVLMLTHLFENGIEKCFDYLPPSEVLDCHRLFGDFQVTLKKREVKEKYIISSIQLKNMVSNSWREVTHFWYMGWPEKGVPSEANSIIAFLIEARSFMKSATIDKKTTLNGDMNGGAASTEVNPVVVHCSPGTGRTGTVITCDIAIREFEQTRQVDIPKIVYRIRRDRASAVQTKEQYAFIYKVIDLYATKLAGGSLESI